jgi:hypothetical protein
MLVPVDLVDSAPLDRADSGGEVIPREHVNFRMKPEGHQRIKDLAAEYGLSVTEVIRSMLAIAFAHPDEIKKNLSQSKENL